MSGTTTNDSVVAPQQGDSTPDDVMEPGEKGLPKVSVLLTEARNVQGISQQDIAERLYLSVRYIKNIDEGEFEKIGKPAFLKGYLRSYARELGLSGDEIVAVYEAELKEAAGEISRLKDVTEQQVGSSIFTGPVATTGIYSLIGIASILVAIWWLSPETEKPVVTSIADEKTLVSDAPETTELNEQSMARVLPFDDIESRLGEVDRMEVSTAADADLPETDAVTENDSERLIVESTAGITETVNDVGASQTGITISRSSDLELQRINVAAGGDDHLQVVFTDDCWLEITDASGNLLYGDLNHDKDILDLFGVAPFRLLIGKVSAVTVTFNDRRVSFEGKTFNDTARVVIE